MTRIPITAKVDGSAPLLPRRRMPLTVGVPLARGAVTEPGEWALVGEDGAPRLVQTRVMDRWADKSVRWLLVDAQIDIHTDGSRFFLESISGEPPANSLAVAQNGDAVVVDTGTSVFRMRPGTAFPFESITGATELWDAGPCRLSVHDGHGHPCDTVIRNVEVIESGALRASIRLGGEVRCKGAEFLLVEGWLDLYAGHNTVRVRVTLTNPRRAEHKGGFWDLGDPGAALVEDLTLSVHLPTHSAVAGETRCSLERAAPWQSLQVPFELYQDSSGGERWNSSNHLNRDRRVPLTFRGYRVANGATIDYGLRATPIVVAGCGPATVGVCVPYFWENFAKAITVDESSIQIGLFPHQHADKHEIQAGEQKTHELYLSFGTDTVSDPPLDWCRTPVIGCVDPAWILSTGAVPFLTQLDHRQAELVSAAVDGPDRFELKREIVDEYGWRNFGDIYGDHEAVRHTGPGVLVSHYNNQYDPIAGFLHQFFRTGDPRWRRMATELASHVIDIDVYHTVRDKWAYNHGMFWHTYHYGDADIATHRTYPSRSRTHGGGPSADHNYTTGLMVHYFLTGDELSRRTVVDSAQFVIDMDDGRKTPLRWLSRAETGRATLSAPLYFGPGRAAANSLIALLNGYRLTGEVRFLAKSEGLIRRTVHPHDSIERLQLDVPEERWFYTMFWQSLGLYLHFKEERCEYDDMHAYARHSLLHYARWMAAHEQPYFDRPEKLVYRTETWPAQELRKSDAFYFAAMHTADTSERQLFLEKGRFFFDYAVDTMSSFATRTFARPVVIMLTSGFMHVAVAKDLTPVRPLPPLPDFGVRRPFVSQRQRAEKRARLLAVAGIVLAAIVAIWLLVG